MKNKFENIKEFETFFNENYKMFCYFAKKYLPNIEDAEDVVSQVFLKYWENKDKIQIKQSIKNYFFTSIKNTAINHIKKNKIKHIEITEVNQQIIEDENLETIEMKQMIIKTIENLNENQRKIFMMSRYDNLKNREIAENLKMSIKNVEYHISKTLKLIKNNLKEFISIILFFLLG